MYEKEHSDEMMMKDHGIFHLSSTKLAVPQYNYNGGTDSSE